MRFYSSALAVAFTATLCASGLGISTTTNSDKTLNLVSTETARFHLDAERRLREAEKPDPTYEERAIGESSTVVADAITSGLEATTNALSNGMSKFRLWMGTSTQDYKAMKAAAEDEKREKFEELKKTFDTQLGNIKVKKQEQLDQLLNQLDAKLADYKTMLETAPEKEKKMLKKELIAKEKNDRTEFDQKIQVVGKQFNVEGAKIIGRYLDKLEEANTMYKTKYAMIEAAEATMKNIMAKDADAKKAEEANTLTSTHPVKPLREA